MSQAHEFLETLAIVLCTAAVTTVAFQRLRQPVVLGYLLAGMIVGPNIPLPLFADGDVVRTLSELGVILLMFSLGTEFTLAKLLRVGRTAGLIAPVECSLMVWLGFLAGKAFGWSQMECVYAGALIAISSTTVIVKAFEEQRVREPFVDVVYGVLIVEDLIAILLITVLTTISSGGDVSAVELAVAAGRLALFLAVLVAAGLLIVPRLMRTIVALDRPETTVVASVGIAFAGALLAFEYGYSVALGAFIAGSLVAESGVQHTVARSVRPVRDIFAAIFFVSVGMLIDPALIAAHATAVAVFVALVVIGKLAAITMAAFVGGHSVPTSVRAGMSMAQIGEFSFIIAGVGLASGATESFLFPLAVAVSALTTLATPWLIRAAGPMAALVDRSLPPTLQTFVALYGAWLEQLRTGPRANESLARVRHLVRWLAVDAILLAAIVVGTAVEMPLLGSLAEQRLGLAPRFASLVVAAAALLAALPFAIGATRLARALGQELALRAFPAVSTEGADPADVPRRLLVVTLQLAIVVLVGAPLVAIAQPFLPPLAGALAVIGGLLLLAFTYWRRAMDLERHTRAVAQVIGELLARQSQPAAGTVPEAFDDVKEMLGGLDSPVPLTIPPRSAAVGRTLAELNLRGLTGATILAIKRGEESLLVPAGQEHLQAGDVLALAGSRHATEAAMRLLTEPRDPAHGA